MIIVKAIFHKKLNQMRNINFIKLVIIKIIQEAEARLIWMVNFHNKTLLINKKAL